MLLDTVLPMGNRETAHRVDNQHLILVSRNRVLIPSMTMQKVPVDVFLPQRTQHTPDSDFFFEFGGTIHVPAGTCFGISHLYTPNQVTEVLDKRTEILVTNFRTGPVTIRHHTKLCLGITSPEIITVDTSSATYLSDDIRLRPEYIQYAQQRLQFDKTMYAEAFRTMADFRQETWNTSAFWWINPPWKFLPASVIKLCNDQPPNWIFVAPIPRTKEPWYILLFNLVGFYMLALHLMIFHTH